MKKIVTILLGLVMGLTACASLIGCGAKDNALHVVVYSAGYGDQWIGDIVEKYSADTGVEVKLTAEYEVKSIITKNMASKNNPDDLYISTSTDWKTYAAQGKLLPLDDLLTQTVDGVTIADKINDEYADSIYYTDRKGEKHTYRLPWTSGAGGIFYNKKMFEQHGWTIPATYEELVALCDVINGDVPVADRVEGVTYGPFLVEGERTKTVKPFVYTGQNPDYFDYTVYTWWAQLVGTNAIREFLKYTDESVFDTSKNAAYAALETVMDKWTALFASDNYVEGSASKSNNTAQQDFVNGYAVMMFDGDWVYNEILGYSSADVQMDNFELGLMDTPLMTGATHPKASYVIGEDQFIAIPASSDKADQAKELIKYIVSDAGISTFFNKAHSRLAYMSTTEITTTDPFMQNLLDFSQKADDTFTNFSDNLLYLNNVIDIWSIASLRPYNTILGGTSSVDQAFASIQSETARQWSTWKSQVGM